MPQDKRSINYRMAEQLMGERIINRLNEAQFELDDTSKLTINDLPPKPDMRSESSLHTALLTLKECRPGDRSEKDRGYAVVITMLEQAYAYFNMYAVQDEAEGK